MLSNVTSKTRITAWLREVMPKESEAQKFVSMAEIHRKVADSHGEDGTWEAITFLAAHVGRLVDRVAALDKRLKRLECKK